MVFGKFTENQTLYNGDAMKKFIYFIFFSLFSINLLQADDLPFWQNVDIHGDIRTKWKSTWGVSEDHSFKAEATLGCDYIKPEAWVSVKMKAATSNGKDSLMYLDKAFLGYQLLDKSFETADMGLSVEIGRNKMESMFDSKMQYDSYFNGIHLIYSFKEPGVLDFIAHGGPHVVDSSKHHYGWLVEGIWNRIASTPVTMKYSFTDWNAPKKPNGTFDETYFFAISQITAMYEFEHVMLYGAYLYNHQETKYNDGFYLGFTAGKIRKVHDFVFDINFQTTKSYLLSPIDNKGLKKGVQAKFVYALAENFNIETKFSRHDNDNNNKLELQAIYAF